MVSGTPVLTTNLPGMPKEYNDYVYILQEHNTNSIRKKLSKLLKKNKMELHEKGIEAKKFVLNKKNYIVQAKKIIKLSME